MKLRQAKLLREKIEAMAKDLPDEEIVQFPKLCPLWQTDTAYKTGDRVQYGDKPYKCLQDHTSQEIWTPTDAVSLWALIINEGIPVWVQPDSTNPYMKGDKVHYPGISDPIYESLIDNNIWSPEAYPAGWKQL